VPSASRESSASFGRPQRGQATITPLSQLENRTIVRARGMAKNLKECRL
jgi:hypothetical protein